MSDDAFLGSDALASLFLSRRLPFYYEIKILFILWLTSPYGNGARILYKHIIHLQLDTREAVSPASNRLPLDGSYARMQSLLLP